MAKFQTNFEFLKTYGIIAEAEALLQLNFTDARHEETLTLEGIPGDLLFTHGEVDDALLLPDGLFKSMILDEDWGTLFETEGIDLSATAKVTGILLDASGKAKQWRVDDGGKHYFITKVAADSQGAARLEVRGEEQTFDLLPQSFLLQIVGQFTVKDPTQTDRPVGNRDTWFSIRGGLQVKISPEGFEFFAIAKLDLSINSVAKLALVAVNPVLLGVSEVDILGFFVIRNDGRIAGTLDVKINLSTGFDQYGLNDIPDISFSGNFRLVFNSTLKQ